MRPKAVYRATPGPYPVLEKAHGAPEGPRISVVIKKKIEPQPAVLVAREACLHSKSVTVDLLKTSD
jgi:hypothetical protein